jgi:hypothetical protein
VGLAGSGWISVGRRAATYSEGLIARLACTASGLECCRKGNRNWAESPAGRSAPASKDLVDTLAPLQPKDNLRRKDLRRVGLTMAAKTAEARCFAPLVQGARIDRMRVHAAICR